MEVCLLVTFHHLSPRFTTFHSRYVPVNSIDYQAPRALDTSGSVEA
jgi:hypothetical protein